jgi:hypothetical protein
MSLIYPSFVGSRVFSGPLSATFDTNSGNVFFPPNTITPITQLTELVASQSNTSVAGQFAIAQNLDFSYTLPVAGTYLISLTSTNMINMSRNAFARFFATTSLAPATFIGQQDYWVSVGIVGNPPFVQMVTVPSPCNLYLFVNNFNTVDNLIGFGSKTQLIIQLLSQSN